MIGPDDVRVSRASRRSRFHGAATVVVALVIAAAVAGCSGGSGDDEGATPDPSAPTVRLCDAYLDYLADRGPAQLDDVVAGATDTPIATQVATLADIVRGRDDTGRVLAADQDLEDIVRTRCQSEWIAGAQGAGNTGAAAAAMVDALRAGDRFGARNIASANAIAVLEPWDVPEDPADIVVLEVADRFFSMALGPSALAECQVETGVVIACSVTR